MLGTEIGCRGNLRQALNLGLPSSLFVLDIPLSCISCPPSAKLHFLRRLFEYSI